jgi:hypothetical protein
MAPGFLTILTGPRKIRQFGEAEPSTLNAKTVADITRVVDQTGNAAFRAARSLPTRKTQSQKRSEAQLPSTHTSVREFVNAGTISK